MSSSPFIRPMHPKTEIRPDRASIEKVLRAGWAGQLKIHGHRAQIHLPPDESDEAIAYTRHGSIHKKLLPDSIVAELRRVFPSEGGWIAIDAEWIKPKGQLYIFDYLKKNDEDLDTLTYPQRHELLPKSFLSPHLTVLPILRTAEKCWEALQREEPYIEGLVFKSLNTPGFSDTSIIRCRKKRP